MEIMMCELTAGTADASSRLMLYDVCSASGSEFTDGNELVDVVSATDDRDGELIQKQERDAVAVAAVESSLTVLALDRWMALDVVGSLLGGIYWRHTEMYTNDWVAIQVSHWNRRVQDTGFRLIVIIVSHCRWFAGTGRRTTGKQLQ
jgi:hypothetical protein